MPCKTFCACLHRLCPQLCSAFWRAEGVGRIQRKGERCQGAQRAAPSCWDAGSMIRRESGRGDDMGEGGVRKSFILDRSHSLSSREICRSGESGGWFLWKVSLDCEKEKGGACAGRSGPARASWEMRGIRAQHDRAWWLLGWLDRHFQVPSVHKDVGDAANGCFHRAVGLAF
ncbi:uncharacterized protein LOC121064915 isoform X3 [Cygnus olor]|uniref:uncharacterized protein LOC121064915 isoform X3 n=1 Tax=Cygnus olor TaxID=8869 RepID=UPI001ADE1ACD|nr:uncharacterized protein LOC121064915 isoform X3 [Cygnus olor]